MHLGWSKEEKKCGVSSRIPECPRRIQNTLKNTEYYVHLYPEVPYHLAFASQSGGHRRRHLFSLHRFRGDLLLRVLARSPTLLCICLRVYYVGKRTRSVVASRPSFPAANSVSPLSTLCFRQKSESSRSSPAPSRSPPPPRRAPGIICYTITARSGKVEGCHAPLKPSWPGSRDARSALHTVRPSPASKPAPAPAPALWGFARSGSGDGKVEFGVGVTQHHAAADPGRAFPGQI